jgi:hypothetical protein
MRLLVAVVALYVTQSIALGQTASSTPAPPPEIPASQWILISPMLAFVVTEDPPRNVLTFGTPDPTTGKQNAERRAPSSSVVRGYFMVLRNGQWLRLELEPPAARIFDTR